MPASVIAFFRLSAFSLLILFCLNACSDRNRLNAWQRVSEPTTTERYQRFVEEIFQACDTDKNGLLSATEQKENHRQIFENADSNGDGLISPAEILDMVSSGRRSAPEVIDVATAASDKVAEETDTSWRVTATILRLPRSFAKKQILSLEDVFRQVATDQIKEHNGQAPGEGARVIDQFEIDVYDGQTSRLKFSGEMTKLVKKNSLQNIDYGSSISLRPNSSPEGLRLKVKYKATHVLNLDMFDSSEGGEGIAPSFENKPVHMQLESEFEKNVSAVNMFSAGNHFLFMLNVEPL